MEIHNTVIPQETKNQYKKTPSPSFKAGMTGALNASGNLMQSIENGGFLASFLIQDGIGMTTPRTIAGFLRDKEETGHFNMQEGREVFLREGLTGPCMMAVAPVSLLLAAKFGHSTSVNTQLIKYFGNSLKEQLQDPNFDKSLLKNPEKFKEVFYRNNIEKILNDTVGKENTTKESIDYIMEQLANREKIPNNIKLKKFRGKSKYRNECLNNIVSHINNIKYATGTDLELLQKVKLDSVNKVFSTKDTIDALEKYTKDAITANKKLDKLNNIVAESIKNKALGKRLITNIAMMFATLGVLSILPKIYASSNIAPGARKNNAKQSEINFKGKSNVGVIERIGKYVDKIKSNFFSSELEYNGHNFTNTLMAGLSVFGLLTPRGLRAYNRAQVDEDGKKDLTELYEIFLRDLTSSLSVVFAVPMGTRACVTAYEKGSGFVLLNKDRSKNKMQTLIDLFNPYSKAHVLTNAEIEALYNNIDSKAKMLNFCKYIDRNGGDLQKIISKSQNVSSIFNSSTMELSSLKGLKKSEKNKKIISFFEKFNNSNSDELIKKLMKGSEKISKNKIASFARGLNSVPGLLTTFFISPYILGWFIPRLTYANTRRIHAKEDQEKALKKQKLETKV